MIDLEFMKRAEEFAKPIHEELVEKRRVRIDKWNNDNREILHKCQKQYRSSEKGKESSKRRNCVRKNRYKNLCENITHEELENIKDFYMNCEPGFEVDHIIPISKGGKHILSNLQYLTIAENRRKGNKLNWIHWKDLPSLV